MDSAAVGVGPSASLAASSRSIAGSYAVGVTSTVRAIPIEFSLAFSNRSASASAIRAFNKVLSPFNPAMVARALFSEPFGDLSVGAREQVAVITRLALVDVIRVANRPSTIILGDALVNTDEDRLQRMHLVLQRAAQRCGSSF